MTKYKVTLETGGKQVVRQIESDGINHDPFYVSFLNEHRIENVDIKGAQPVAYLVAMIPRERVILIEREG